MSDVKREILDSESILRQLKFMLSLIASNEDMNQSYKAGLYNGLEIAISTIENRDPDLIDVNLFFNP
jgi:hypothetical protein